MTETLFTLGRSIIDRITSPILREMPIAQVASTIQQARISWGERFDPRIQRKYQKYAQHMAETLNKGKFLQTDSYYRALEPADHHIAFNLLAQPVPNEERIPEFIKTWQYKPIEGYFLGLVSHKIPLNDSFTDPDNYKGDFSNYIFHDSDYGDRGKMRVFLRHLIMQQPTLSFLNRERDGELPFF